MLYNGKTIKNVNGRISEFKFSKTDFNISKFGSNSTTHQKTQENSTVELIKCLLILENFKNNFEIKKINNCIYKNLENIYEELYLRLIKPFYIIFLITLSLLLILKSKINPSFQSNKIKIFFFSFLFFIFSESSSKFITTNLFQNLIMSILPFIFVIMIYLYFLITLKVNKT